MSVTGGADLQSDMTIMAQKSAKRAQSRGRKPRPVHAVLGSMINQFQLVNLHIRQRIGGAF